MEKYKVERGMGLSTKCGYPTANVGGFIHSPGVYTATSQFDSCLIFAEIEDFAEIHIIGFNGDIYSEEIELEDVEKCEPETNRGIIYRFNQSFK